MTTLLHCYQEKNVQSEHERYKIHCRQIFSMKTKTLLYMQHLFTDMIFLTIYLNEGFIKEAVETYSNRALFPCLHSLI